MDEIVYTVRHGIRNETDFDAHWSQMTAFDGILEDEAIEATVEYVVSLSNTEFDAEMADAGAALFADNCASCHGDTAQGSRDLGAPNLADAIWLYGGDRAALTETIQYARFGVMPAWGQRLSEEDVRAVSAYVHALGGGE
jgi:cytochrome c oxidase cbb3-type subunit 3